MGGLAKYREKRDFGKTREPEGRSPRRSRKTSTGGAFVVHKHAASRLHYDLRLELDGALKSWAVPKGPSLDPAVRRLAVHVEDHPLDYGAFEGVIPKGEYGGGTVMLWDEGRWEPVGDALDGYQRGELKFRLNGHRLHGAWVLIRMKPRAEAAEDAGDNWLLIKERDEDARSGTAALWGDDDRSVTSMRTMREIAGSLPPGKRRRAAARRTKDHGPAASLPNSASVELATLVAQPPEGDDWVHEIKYDGYRILARLDDGDVSLLTRSGRDWTTRFPTLAKELAKLKTNAALLDGELVAYGPDGVSNFAALQRALREEADGDLAYMAFDLLHLDGVDTRECPLTERKEQLIQLLQSGRGGSLSPVRVSEHITGDGRDFFVEACRQGLEGVVSKRADTLYVGRRTRSWLKSKCGHRQEFVVGGYTDPAGSRAGFGALLVGTYEAAGHLKYAGKVGSGFSDDDLGRLASRLEVARRRSSPFDSASKVRGAHWVTPKLVVEIAFAGWTTEGRLRHPVYKGVREDKPAERVRREGASPTSADKGDFPPATSRKSPRKAPGTRRTASASDASNAAAKARAGRVAVTVAGVAISHPDRIVYPSNGMTKLDVAKYYEAVAERMLPHLAGRPLTVVRCPEGADAECFFQKHAAASLPERVARVTVREALGTAQYPAISSAAALITMVQLGALEFHIWGSREARLETPDRLVFDLDPAPEVEWRDVRAAARLLRDELSGRGLESLVMTSGGKGLHVVVPLRPDAGWDAVGDFARDVAESLVRRSPKKYIASMSKAKRTGKVFIDHFRNGRGATAVAPYSLRARRDAPVATPLEWRELGKTSGGAAWTAPRVLRRLRAQAKDAWTDDALRRRQRLPRTGA